MISSFDDGVHTAAGTEVREDCDRIFLSLFETQKTYTTLYCLQIVLIVTLILQELYEILNLLL